MKGISSYVGYVGCNLSLYCSSATEDVMDVILLE